MSRISTLFVIAIFSFAAIPAFAQPSTQASNITIEPVPGSTTSLKFNWTNGNGTGPGSRLVVISNATGSYIPPNGSNQALSVGAPAFPADAAAGADLDADATDIAAVVYNGTGATATVTVTNLEVNKFYKIQVYEYNGTAATTVYNFSAASNNPVVVRYYSATVVNGYPVPTGVTSATVQAWGGGGGGGGASASSNDRAGGGGAGGTYTLGTASGLTPGSNVTVTVGPGGTAGVDTDGSGGTGGTSSFGSVSAVGGAGGVNCNGNSSDRTEIGGAVSTGVTFNGGGGAEGAPVSAAGNNSATSSGGGGGSPGISGIGGLAGTSGVGAAGGAAGAGGGAVGATGVTKGGGESGSANGAPGNFPGSGGSGGADFNNTGNKVGGIGGGGLVIVSYTPDVIPPTATIIREPATANSFTTNATVQFKVTFNEPVTSVSSDGSDFSVAAGGTVTTGAITVTGSGPYIVSIATVAGDGTLDLNFAGGQNITDIAGNLFGGTTAGDETYDIDNTSPVISATAPVSSSLVNNNNVSYTLSEAIASGSITWTRTGGTADGGSPHVQALTGTELATGAHSNITLTNNPTLVSGTIYSIAFNATDAASNAATAVTNTTVTLDNTAPVFSATAPATGSSTNTTNVSYTLSEAITSGSITWTRTGGTADGGSPHVQALTGTELTTGAHSNITLTNNPTLVDGTIYSIAFNGTDVATNAATTVTNTNIIYDVTAPVISATAPASSSLVNNNNVSYTLSEAIASGSITWTRTSGTADAGSPHVQALTGTELTTGAHSNITLTNNPTLVNGTIYSIAFNATDAAGNTATTITNTSITVDNAAPVFSATAPATGSSTNTTNVSYTLSEAITSGSITWTRTGGTADGGSPHVQALTGTELATGAHSNITLTNNPTLVDGTIYSIAFNGTDVATNAATTVTNTNVTYDVTAPVISATAPASSSLVNNNNVSYTLSEAIASGSITWTRTGGTADAGSPHVQALTGTELATGAHSNITLTNNPTLVDGTIYSIAFNATDAAGNTATTITNTSITVDNAAPVFSATAPATGSSVNTTNVSYTLSEAITSGSITWTRTGGTADAGSPHVQALTGTELASGAHSNITLTNNPTLVDGAIYSIAFNGSDVASNAATTVTNTNVKYDFTNPVISATAPASSAIVNNRNVSYTLSEAIASGTVTWTRTGGTADGSSPHVQALTGTELATGAHSNITLTNNPTLVSGTEYSISFDATDAAGNTATTITNTTITFDNTAPAFSATAPASSTSVNTAKVSYTLSEAIASGSITWTRTGGAADGGSPRVQALTGTELATGAHTDITLTNNPSLVNGTIYTVTFNGTDAAGNAATTVTKTAVTFDTSPPAVFTVGAITTATGTVVANYWNGTNGSINVVVPIANDNSLNGGTVQLRMKNGSTSFSDIGSASTISATNTTKTINIPGGTLTGHASYDENEVLTFTAVITDLAGNTRTGTQSGTSLTVDTTPPSVVTTSFFADNAAASAHFHNYNCNGTNTNKDSNTEFIHLELTEALSISNGTFVSIGSPGFSVSAGVFDTDCENSGGDKRGASVYHSSGTTIHLKSSGDGQWNGTTTISFTTGGSNIKDAAGNEMGSFSNILPSDNQPPVLVTGLVFSPNGTGAETITFQLSETLNASVGTSPTGFSTTPADASMFQSYNPGTNTITLTSSADQKWTDAVTVTYALSGNVVDPANNELGAFTLPIRLINVHLSSDNGNTPVSRAKTGNTITLGFTTTTALSALPTATIGGQTATVTGGPVNYSATITASAALPEGTPLAIAINAETANDITDVIVTTDDSQMSYDKTAPGITPISISSNNANSTARAKVGNTVTLAFSVSEALFATPTVTIGGRAATVTGGPVNYSASLLLDGSEPTGVLAFNISVEDPSDNATSATATTNSSSVNFDKTPPVVDHITLNDANPNNTTAVTFDVVFTEPVTDGVSAIDANDFSLFGGAATGAGSTASITNVTGSGATRTVTVSGINLTGTLGLKVEDDNSIEDIADNDLGGTAVDDGDFSSATQYDMILAEPANHATLFAVSGPILYNTVSLTWTDAIGSPLPSGYLITVARSGATATTPNDFGTPIGDQINLVPFANTTGYLNVPYGVHAANFTNLLAGETYTFKIYPYTNSGSNIDFKINGSIPTLTGIVTPVASNVWINNFTPVEPPSFPSTTTSSGVAVVNFRLEVSDDAWVFSPTDNASTKITAIKIRRDATDQIGNWNNALAGVELTDGTTTKTGVIDGTGNFITFSGLYNGTTEFFGEVPDNTAKYYSLKLILKTSLGANLPQIIDNRSFIFEMNNADITLAPGSSLLQPQNDVSYPIQTAAGTNAVSVVATQLDFSTSPDATQLALTNVTTTSTAPDFVTLPVIRARDVNGNTDRNFSGAGAITVTSSVAFSPSTALTMNNGVAVMPAFQYLSAGNGTLTASTTLPNASSVVPNSGNSSTVTVNFSNTSTIASATGSTNSNIPSTGTSFAAIQPYRFTITDDGGPGVGDGSPTRISKLKITKKASASPIPDWTDILNVAVNGTFNNAGALIAATDGSSWMNAKVSVTKDSITIYNMLNGDDDIATELGYIGDGLTRTYRLFIWLKPTMTGGLPSVVDHMNFDFEVDPANIEFVPESSTISPTQLPVNSGPRDVDVAATKLIFTTQPPSDVLVNTDLSTSPIVEAQDLNGNRDLDYAPSTGVTISNTGVLPMTNAPTAFVNGVLTFPSNFRYTQIGNGTLTVASSTIATGLSIAPANAVSSPLPSGITTVRVGISGTITASATLTEPDEISSLDDDGAGTATGGTDVFDFTVNDDPAGTPALEDDGNPLRIFSIKITPGDDNTIGNWHQAIGAARLSDGTNTLFGTVSATSIDFTGILNASNTQLGHIIDGNSKTYTLRIWLKEAMLGAHPATIDGKFFEFEVLATAGNVTTNPNGSSIIDGENASSGTNKNEVTVDATKLDFTSLLPGPVTASINSNFSPAIVVESRDVNGNRDVDFDGDITDFDNPPNGLTMINKPDPSNVLDKFTAGVFVFNAGFQYTSDGGGATGAGTLNMKANSIATGTIPGTSPSITVQSSYESQLVINPTVSGPIEYINYQATGPGFDLTAANSKIIADLTLSDGGIFSGTDTDGDIDGANTILSQFTISITNSSNIRNVALYTAGGVEIPGTEQLVNGASTVTFSSLTITANDLLSARSTADFTIRATFEDNGTDVQDGDLIDIKITAAILGSGSRFYKSTGAPDFDASYIGGILNGSSAPSQSINVTATRLDFTTQPEPFEGIERTLITTPEISARDAKGVVDKSHNAAAIISRPALPPTSLSATSFNFVSGLLTLTGLQYKTPGDGTLTVTSGPLSSNTGGSIACSHVDVINTNTSLASGGVTAVPNLPGGAVNRVIFGATFNVPYAASGEPKLDKFIISFSNPITNVLKNFRVFSSTNNTYEGADPDVTGAGATLSIGTNSITVDYGTPVSLSSPRTFFLMVDVEQTASGSTPKIRPLIFNDNTHIFVTEGSVYSTSAFTEGTEYTFASIFPPVLVSTNPATGQLNVDPNKGTVELVFSVPVWSLDRKVLLYDKENASVPPVVLSALNGNIAGGSGGLAGTATTPLQFALPTLLDDHLYYILIAPGKKPTTGDPVGAGIVDESSNEFPGISYSGAWYFKTANPNPPILSTATVTNAYASGAILNTTFDQRGKAYFMVLNQGSPAPSNAQIKGTAIYAGAIYRGNFSITQTSVPQFGMINSPLTAGNNYDVWIYAENDALPTPKVTTAPYGSASDSFVPGSGSATVTFAAGASPATAGPVVTSTSFCKDSYQPLSAPILIVENSNGDFQATGTQIFNILLPTGFQFDLTTPGSLNLSGGDFSGGGSLAFINASTLRVSYQNTGAGTRDQIAISGLRILGNTSTSGDILRLGGNALTVLMPDLTVLANLSSFDASTLITATNFTNSYTRAAYNSDLVTTIPDNHNSPSFNVELIPVVAGNDYGPSSFAGQGVNVNQLNLSAVTKNTPFNITHTHTDNNGCLSNFSVQYTVYDHTKAIQGLSLAFCADNSTFPLDANYNTPDLVQNVFFNNLAAHQMYDLQANVPFDAAPVSANTNKSQIIYGADWNTLLQTLPVITASFPDANNANRAYKNYKIDAAIILNASTLSAGAIPNPYSNFDETTPQGNIYYTGGSLGLVEFTGLYQNIANASVELPLKQSVEFFLPARPVVELSRESDTDGSTPIFCKEGGNININAYPAAAVGASVGRFELWDVISNTKIAPLDPVFPSTTPVPVAGFTDNGNGTATLNPALIWNNFRDIEIVYTYKENGSPCFGVGRKIIRIQPNPLADFTPESLPGANVVDATSYCEEIPVSFDASVLSTISTGSIEKFKWNFSDGTQSSGSNLNEIEGDFATASDVSHYFTQSAEYDVSLIATSTFGCASAAKIIPIKVGAIPVGDFDFTGIVAGAPLEPVSFNNKSVVNSASSLNDAIVDLDWDFDDGDTYNTPDVVADVPHPYSNSGKYNVTLTVTTDLGCRENIQKLVVLVPKVSLTDLDEAYNLDFENNNDGGYQFLSDEPSPTTDAWSHAIPAGAAIKGDNLAWTTVPTGAYNPGNSALYTACFDISALARPIITFNSFRDLGQGDGVVLEYSTDIYNIADSRKSWKRLGELKTDGTSTGVFWYNGTSLPSKPGDQLTGDNGWTGTDSEWRVSKHSLADIPKADRGRVVFRFAFSSVFETPENDGFAMDEIRVGNGTRTVLIENFTNTSSTSPDVKAVSDEIMDFEGTNQVGLEVIKLNYHVAFPGEDPFNMENPIDPGSRALYYGVSTVPQTRLDGTFKTEPGPLFSEWGLPAFNSRILDLGNATISVDALINSEGMLTVAGTFTPTFTMTRPTILHVVVAEENISIANNPVLSSGSRIRSGETVFEYVVRKMLPNATGTKYTQALTEEVPVSFGPYEWANAALFKPEDDISVIVFLQDENTKEIYQAFIKRNINDPGTVTGTEDLNNTYFKVFPNPADREMMIELPTTATKRTALKMYDQMGKTVEQSFFEKGETTKTITTESLAGGVYLIQIETDKGVLRRKVMVAHRN